MDKVKGYSYKQPNYELIANMVFWTIDYAVELLTLYKLRQNKYSQSDEATNEYNHVYCSIMELVEHSVESRELALNIREYEVEADGYNEYIQHLILKDSKISPVNFIIWAISKKITIPEEFKRVLPYYQSSEASKYEADVTMTDSEIAVENIQVMYPIYKGLEFDTLSKEKFDEVKKHYGMLQKEVDKLNKTVQIATNVGLLFYEKGLKKPATANAFKGTYNAHFAGIPGRLVEAIYNALPDNYKSFGGESAKEHDKINAETLELIIEASVAAGLIYSDSNEPFKDVNDLEEQLARYEFELPESFVKPIHNACKRAAKHYERQQA